MTLRRRLTLVGQWVALGATVGTLCGISSGIFLLLLDRVTTYRIGHEGIIYLLPLAGLIIGLAFGYWGQSIKGGNNLIIDAIHRPTNLIPLRMAPMVLAGTLATHLFGGSAGREGTAVQMGGALSDAFARRFQLNPHTRKQLLAAGMAGGFGSVFGTPIAGALFGIEVVVIGRIEYDALVPSLVASLIGDRVARSMGVIHTVYPSPPLLDASPIHLAKSLVIGLAAALVAMAFVDLTHTLKRKLETYFPKLPIRMMVGGIVVVMMWKVAQTGDYLGLGVPTIVRSFTDPELPMYAFAAKLLFTSVTLAAGFVGGEVTPLFFIGAALGNVLARALSYPLALGAGISMAAVFGAAANTPLALSMMAIELLGANVLPHVLVATIVAYVITGHRGIYPSQRLFQRKSGGVPFSEAIALRDLNDSAATHASESHRKPNADDTRTN